MMDYRKWMNIPLALLAVLAFSTTATADDEDDARGGVYMEEVIVTAEKREASVQDTAATISAFDDAALDRENIDDILDIQFSVPNLLFSAFNFSTPHLTIRGIGREAVGVSADDGTAIHVNGAFTVGAPLLELEFFDVQRVEILRGPQGTLYGRNSTGGVVNFITNRPDLSEPSGEFTIQAGNHETRKGTIMVNLPVTDRFGIRFAGYSLDRDGYVKNDFTGNTIDDRDVTSARLSLRWTGELTDINLIMDYFEEDDTRMRTSKQDCVTDTRAMPFSVGCNPGHELGTYGTLNGGITLANVFANQAGLYGSTALLGVATGSFAGFVDGINHCIDNDPEGGYVDGPDACAGIATNPTDLRTVSAASDPTYLRRNYSITLEVVRDVRDDMQLTVLAHHTKNLTNNTTDYNWVGDGPEFANGARLQSDIDANNTNIALLDAGISMAESAITTINGGLDTIAATIATNDNNFTIDTAMDAASAGDQLIAYHGGLDATADAAAIAAINTAVTGNTDLSNLMISDFDGVNTALATSNGTIATLTPQRTGLTGANGALINVRDNVLDADGFLRQSFIDAWDPTLTPVNFGNGNDLSYGETETNSFEVRLVSDFQDSPWDFTAGAFTMRYTLDDSRYEVHAPGLALIALSTWGDFGPDTDIAAAALALGIDDPLGGRDQAFNPAPAGRDLSYYLNNSFYTLNTWAVFGELYRNFGDDSRLSVGLRYTDEEKEINDASQSLIVIQQRQSGRVVASEEVTGRIGFDHRFGEDALFFTNLSRSYKSGGLNAPSSTGAFPQTFDPEYVDAVEFGVKSTLAGGRVQVNATYFFYDYEGLQTSKIVDRTSVNENIDAKLQGVEFELVAYPKDSLRLDFNLAYLGTEVLDFQTVNNADPVAGRSGWTTVKATDASNWIAPTEDLDGSGELDADDAIHACENPNDYPGIQCAAAGGGLPVVTLDTSGTMTTITTDGFHTAGANVPFGFLTDATGNQLPNSPETSAKLGLQWTANLPADLRLISRVDYYWQDAFYGRAFNDRQTLIPEWDVTNLAITLMNEAGTWSLEAYVKNVNDDDHITGLYFTDASSGNFTNIFLLEPRTSGLTWNYNF